MKIHLTLYGLALAVIIACAGYTKADETSREDRKRLHEMYHDQLYNGITTPKGASCCGDAECMPVPSRFQNGKPEVLLYGDTWCPVPEEITIRGKPAVQFHACYALDKLKGNPCLFLWCVIEGAAM